MAGFLFFRLGPQQQPGGRRFTVGRPDRAKILLITHFPRSTALKELATGIKTGNKLFEDLQYDPSGLVAVGRILSRRRP
jgi:hypothetical protein